MHGVKKPKDGSILMVKGLGIDLGSANMVVYAEEAGIVLNEPSVVAMDRLKGEIVAVGEEAKLLSNSVPDDIVTMRPLVNGLMSDYQATEIMLKYLLEKVCIRKGYKSSKMVVCIPAGSTRLEEQAILEATRQAGAKQAFPLPEPIAAAIGVGLPIEGPAANLVIHSGARTTSASVIALGEIIESVCQPTGGDKINESIVLYLRNEHNLLISDQTAEEVKKKIGEAYSSDSGARMTLRGRDLSTGLSRALEITAGEIHRALSGPLQEIVKTAKSALSRTSPELSADLFKTGAILTGGTALLRGLDKLLSSETNISVRRAKNPISCVAEGCGKALDSLRRLRKNL